MGAKAVLSLALLPLLWATPSIASPSDALAQRFTQQEQILLSGVLAGPAAAQEFARDAASPSQATMDKWRQRIALFSREYLDSPHAINEAGRTVQQMVAPAEWEMLMTSLRMLSAGGVVDQAKFRIFLAMLDNANSDLAANPPDTRNAHKVIALGRSKVTEAMNEYLSSPVGKAALAEARRQRAVAQQKAQDEENSRQAAQAAEARKRRAAEAAAAKKRADGATPEREASAREQAESVASEMKIAAEDPEKASRSADQGYDGAGSAGTGEQAPPVQISGGGSSLSALSGLMPSTSRPPVLEAEPPAPGARDDMAELHSMKKKVSGHKKWYLALGLGLLGAAVGFLLGGTTGAAIGGSIGAVGGHRAGHHLWG